MNKSKTVVATLGFAVAAAFAGSALAQSQESAWYAGASIGQSEGRDVDCSGTDSCDKKDTAWKIFGGYQFNRYLAAEAGYTDLGKIKGSSPAASFEVKSNAWELVAVGSYPIGTSGFAPYVKGGLYRGETKTSVSVGDSGKETNTDWTAGIGVRYDFMQNFAVRVEWQRYNGVSATAGGSSLGDTEIDVISIGALYKF